MDELSPEDLALLAEWEAARLEAADRLRAFQESLLRMDVLEERVRTRRLEFSPGTRGAIEAVREMARDGNRAARKLLEDDPCDLVLVHRVTLFLRELQRQEGTP